LPGQTVTFANYSSYSKGINGIMVDLSNAPNAAALTAADFSFSEGNTATPSSWSSAPAPLSVTDRPGAGIGGSDRIEIIWSDGSIKKQWLQITVKADSKHRTVSPGCVPTSAARLGRAQQHHNTFVDAVTLPGTGQPAQLPQPCHDRHV